MYSNMRISPPPVLHDPQLDDFPRESDLLEARAGRSGRLSGKLMLFRAVRAEKSARDLDD